MRRFLGNIALFLSCLLIVSIVADFFYSRALRNSTGANNVIWKDVMEGDASADLLICGDSRANTDCYPPVIDSITGIKSYSIGVIGHHFNIQRLRYDMYRRYNSKPTVIAQFVDNKSFKMAGKYDRIQFLPWMWNGAFLNEAFKLEPLFFVPKAIPWFRYRGTHLSDLRWEPFRPIRGFYTYEPDYYHGFAEEELTFIPNSRNEGRFREYLSELSREGLKVVLVLAPICGSRSFKGDSILKTRSCFKSIAQEYGIPVLDYLQRPAYEDSTLFIDSMHLNERGARMFSDSLANDILSLGLIKD